MENFDRDFLRRALYMMIGWDCGRYCLCTFRGESAEKADIHWKISAIIASLIWGDNTRMVMREDGLSTRVMGRSAIHEYLTDNLTDNMDQVLGMPIGTYRNGDWFDSTLWGGRMFNWIWDHLDDMLNLEH